MASSAKMRTGIKVTGADEMRLLFQKMEGRTVSALRDEMVMLANDVRDIAEDMAPEDTGGLAASIQVKTNEGTKLRFAVAVVAGDYINEHGVNVSLYAAKVHEFWDPEGEDALKRAEEKSNRTGYTVGEKYLERALEEVGNHLEDDLVAAIQQIGGYTSD